MFENNTYRHTHTHYLKWQQMTLNFLMAYFDRCIHVQQIKNCPMVFLIVPLLPLLWLSISTQWGCFESSRPPFSCRWNEMSNTTLLIQTQEHLNVAENYLKNSTTNNPTVFLLKVYGENTRLGFSFRAWKYSVNAFRSTCLIIMLLIVGKRGWRNERLWKAILLTNGLQSYQLRLSEA